MQRSKACSERRRGPKADGVWTSCAGAAGASGQAAGGGASGNPGTGGEGNGGGRSGGAGAPGQGAGGTGSSNACSFSIEAQISPKIAEVGIVAWSTTFADVRSAHIEFGETTAYGMKAPVDLASPGYRTLLLGMRSSETYHFRVVATASSGACASEDQTMTTGALPSSLPKTTVRTAGTAVAPSEGSVHVGHAGRWFGRRVQRSQPRSRRRDVPLHWRLHRPAGRAAVQLSRRVPHRCPRDARAGPLVRLSRGGAGRHLRDECPGLPTFAR